jgi:hypothetical protein
MMYFLVVTFLVKKLKQSLCLIAGSFFYRLQRTGILPTESCALGLSLLKMHHAFLDLDFKQLKLARMASFLGFKRAKGPFLTGWHFFVFHRKPTNKRKIPRLRSDVVFIKDLSRIFVI